MSRPMEAPARDRGDPSITDVLLWDPTLPMAHETRVLTTAIVLETRRGNYALATAFAIVLLLIAFAVNSALTRAQPGTQAMHTARDASRVWS